MIFNTNNNLDKAKAKERFNYLMSKSCTFELVEKKPKRTYKQNRYLHLILSYFGLETGYTLEESKELYKRLNKETYEYTKNDLIFVKSSAKLDSKEMTITIDKFRNWSSKNAGVFLPSPEDTEYLRELEREVKNKQQYL